MIARVAVLAALLALASCGPPNHGGTWTQTYPKTMPGDVPAPRFFHSQWENGNNIYVFGGQTTDGYLNDLIEYTINKNIVTTIDSGTGPSARAGHCTVFLPTDTEIVCESTDDTDNCTTIVRNAKIIIIGGTDGSTYFSDTWLWDTANSSWTQMADAGSIAPAPRAFHTCVVSGEKGEEKISAFGGKNADQYFGADDFVYFQVDVANNTKSMWSSWPSSDNAPSARAYIQASYEEDYDAMVFFGGYNGSSLSENWAYSFESQTWHTLTTETSPPRTAGYAGLNGQGDWEMFGGFGEGNTTYSSLYSFKFFPPQDSNEDFSGEWIQLTVAPGSPAPGDRAGCVMTRHGKDEYMYGGADASLGSDGVITINKVFDDVWMYSQH